MRNLVITPSTGAPLELGSPFGSTGWVKSTSVQLGDGSVGNITHDPVVGSFLRRLPNVVAAWPAGASRSSAPPAARRAAVRRFVRWGIWVLSGGANGGQPATIVKVGPLRLERLPAASWV